MQPLLHVEAQHERHKDARDHDVTEAEQRELDLLGVQVFGEEQLDRRVDPLGHRHHHLGAEHPEDVVQEERAQQQRADLEGAEREHLDGAQREGGGEHVRQHPALGERVRERDADAQREQRHVERVELNLLGLGVFVPELPAQPPHVRLEGLHSRQRLQRRAHRLVHRARAQPEEVHREEHVEVLLLDEFDDDVQPDQHGRAVERELHRLLLGDSLGLSLAGRRHRLRERAVAAHVHDDRRQHEHVRVRVHAHHRRREDARAQHGVRDRVDHERAKLLVPTTARSHDGPKVGVLERRAAHEEAVHVW
mmetsp:Transcript_20197/g.52100  ORF Transcript_20197/g.52100 Transcript_20197/m.52100 type:complete len:307 (-) Transcript_20197:648-1568(-)